MKTKLYIRLRQYYGDADPFYRAFLTKKQMIVLERKIKYVIGVEKEGPKNIEKVENELCMNANILASERKNIVQTILSYNKVITQWRKTINRRRTEEQLEYVRSKS